MCDTYEGKYVFERIVHERYKNIVIVIGILKRTFSWDLL